MEFSGFQKLTLLDYPGKVACTLFTKGCNFYCPFCHNAQLVEGAGETPCYSDSEILSYLKKRAGILEGVCITGGEPLLHTSLEAFIAEVKSLGYSVKLDTNGSLPARLKALVKKGLIDYVAMDVKNSLDKYREIAGCLDLNLSHIEESIDFLLTGEVDYEFRTTVVSEFHTVTDIEAIAKRIAGAKHYFLQNFVNSEHVLKENLHSVPLQTLQIMQEKAAQYVVEAALRGI